MLLYTFFWCWWLLALVLYSDANWHIHTTHPPLPTHPTTVLQDFCSGAHGLTRTCWWVVLYAPTNNPHSPTNPFPLRQRSRFIRWHASFNSDNDPRTYSGNRNNEKNANAVEKSKCCWWVMFLYAPSNNLLTPQHIHTWPRCKVSSLTPIEQQCKRFQD